MDQQINIFYPGDIVEVLNRVDCETKNIATVKAVEQDDEFPEVYYMYLVANESVLNDKFDERFGYYWDMFVTSDPYIKIISRAVE